MKDVFARCFKKIAVPSMYSNYCAFTPDILMHSHTLSLFLHPGNLIRVILIGVYFRSLKIKHDTHEFILESGTWLLFRPNLTVKKEKLLRENPQGHCESLYKLKIDKQENIHKKMLAAPLQSQDY
jgi:hypothetical protein